MNDLSEDSCIIESANGRIDASVDTQLSEIKVKLTDMYWRVESMMKATRSITPDRCKLIRLNDYGRVKRVVGLMIESQGPESSIGDVCYIHTGTTERNRVIQLKLSVLVDENVILMPYTCSE